MPDYVYREDQTDIERWISFYEWFVDHFRDGYNMCVHEYTNDLSCREQLEQQRNTPEAQDVWPRVAAADTAFRKFLIPTKCAIYGDAPSDHFWFWGYPDGSAELEADLKSMGAL